MENEKRERLIVPDEDGVEHLFNVIYEFVVDTTGFKYVALSPVEQENDEEQELYVFRIEEKDEDITLFQIEDDEEWQIIEETIETLEDDGII